MPGGGHNPPIAERPSQPASPPSSGAGWRGPARRVAALLLPEHNPGAVAYGTIIVGGLLAAESAHHESYGEAIASALTIAAIFWLSHAYSTALERRLRLQERITARGVVRAVTHDWALMRGAAIPVVALLLAWATGSGLQSAITLALWSSAAAIFLFELAAGIDAGATGRELALDATVGAMLGGGVLALHAILA
jgi:hypothetical protein